MLEVKALLYIGDYPEQGEPRETIIMHGKTAEDIAACVAIACEETIVAAARDLAADDYVQHEVGSLALFSFRVHVQEVGYGLDWRGE